MKAAVIRYLFVAVAAVLFLIVAAGIFEVSAKMFEEKSLEHLRRFIKYKSYLFSINDLLVDPNDPTAFDSTKQNEYYASGTDPTFCQDVRNCIEMKIIKGENCVITYKVKPNTPFSIDSFKNALAACPPTTLKEEMYGNTQRKICDFKPITKYKELREDNLSIIDYEPDIHNCYLPDSLGSLNVINDVDSINYIYSGRGNQSGYSFENGGMVRIVITNVSLKKDIHSTCSYSLYVCGQNSIGAREDETTVQVFKKVQNLDERELYYNETIVWGGPPGTTSVDYTWWFWCSLFFGWTGLCGGPPTLPVGYNLYGYVPRPYEFNFLGLCQSRKTCDKALIDAVDAGMWEWNKIHLEDKNAMKYFLDAYYPEIENIYFSYSPITLINEDSSIVYDSGCWNTYYENLNVRDRTKLEMGGTDVFKDSQSLKHIFNFDNLPFNVTTGDKIRMVLGIKKIFITGKSYHFRLWPFVDVTTSALGEVINKYGLRSDFEPRAILVMDPVTFCNAYSEPQCGDGIDNDGDGLIDGADPDCLVPPYIEYGGCGNNRRELWEECDGTDDAACPGSCLNCKCYNAPPVALFTKSADTVTVGESINFNATDSYDPDGSITNYTWNFEDSTSVSTGMIVTHAYSNTGIYTVTLIVTDDKGELNFTTSNVTVISGGCLEKGSKIMTVDGFKNIENLKVGDYVIGYENGKKVTTKIYKTSSHKSKWILYYYKGTWFTWNHMVYPSLNEEDVLVTFVSNQTKEYEGEVYNIETETHNYFGENGLLIHNAIFKV